VSEKAKGKQKQLAFRDDSGKQIFLVASTVLERFVGMIAFPAPGNREQKTSSMSLLSRLSPASGGEGPGERVSSNRRSDKFVRYRILKTAPPPGESPQAVIARTA
jgi:hypothetical protein